MRVMAKGKSLDESLRVGHQSVNAALDAFYRLESLLSAIDRLADEPHNITTISGLADIGLNIAHELAGRLDRALVHMACNATEPEIKNG
jgi:hypothetical protein